ncbi:MAG TPA: 50S ribosomal protein L2 [Thermoplasmata archaeon]|nr:50S ribosomal protein L2 [Thermoplasmata archaeon]HUI38170.1 50S ribosomal protein L2 [Thermoplasmata archaeon]
MGKRIISRRRGAGTGPYRSPSHRHHGAVYLPSPSIEGPATVVRLAPAPGRTAPVADVRTAGGVEVRLVAAAGLASGDKVSIHRGPLLRGSVLSLSEVPDGTLVSNIEVNPFDGGRLVRAAGTSALVVAHTPREVTLQLPSGVFKNFLPTCRVQVGTVAGGGRLERPIIKAGKKVLAYRTLARAAFKVRGVAMNPVNHPFGGGSHQHVGRPSTVKSGAWPGAKVGRFSRSQRRRRAARQRG